MGNVENPYPYIRKATIVVHGEGIYGGSKKITFTIEKRTMKWNDWFSGIASWMEGIL